MVPLVALMAKQSQRSDHMGRPQIVGCIPYRCRNGHGDAISDGLEILLITSRNGQGMKFPKGVWKLDESLEEAAFRVALVGAGVIGYRECELGKWRFLGKKFARFYEAYMFPLRVAEQVELWPEQNARQRIWMAVSDAREVCQHWWMIEALDILVERLTPSRTQEEEDPEIAEQVQQDDDTVSVVGSREAIIAIEPILQAVIAIEPDSNVDTQGRRNGWIQKVSLGWLFVITNVILELPSTVLDQLSSEHKPRYVLFAMLISFAALLSCIVELIYKGRKEKVYWKWQGMLPWFYCPLQNHKPFGSFNDIFGSVCAFCQCIVTAVNYAQSDQPIKISVWPILFAFGLLCSKVLQNPERRVIPRRS